ncbi:hypothetical protein F1641_00245 [Quadrisphaera sp. INWT6]|nr:hypothetical protein [Quadrisphaera sp. INWT6]
MVRQRRPRRRRGRRRRRRRARARAGPDRRADHHGVRPRGRGAPVRARAVRRARTDAGSLAVELVAVVPVLLVVTLLCVQGFGAVSAVEATQRAARDAARAASLGEDPVAAARADLPLAGELRRVSTGGGCGDVCVRVDVEVPLGVPGFVTLVRLPVSRTAAMPAG